MDHRALPGTAVRELPSRAQQRRLERAHKLLSLLLDLRMPSGPVVLGIEDTIERRRGKQISAKGS